MARLLRRLETISTKLGPSRWAKMTGSQNHLPLLVGVNKAVIPQRRKTLGTISPHSYDYFTTLVACSNHAVVLRGIPTLGTGIANLLHGLPSIAGRAEAVIAPSRKALWTAMAYFDNGATGSAVLGGKAVTTGGGSGITRGTKTVTGHRSYGLLGLGGMDRGRANSHQNSQRPQ